MVFGTLPPELNSGRLRAGPGPAPMTATSAAWTALSTTLTEAAAEITGILSRVGGAWQGTAATQSATSHIPYLAWLETTAAQCAVAAARAATQAATYTTTLVAMPTLEELTQNHVTHATLEATNFLGINTAPIGANEADYARMWAHAAALMAAYLSSTSAATVFEPFLTSPPIMSIVPVGQGIAEAAINAQLASVPLSKASDAALTAADAALTGQLVAQAAAQPVARTGGAAALAAGASNNSDRQQDSGQKSTKDGAAQLKTMMQSGSQLVSQAAQIPQQLAQIPQQMAQSLSQPVQQLAGQISQFMSNSEAQKFLSENPGFKEHIEQAGFYGSGLSGGGGAGTIALARGSGLSLTSPVSSGFRMPAGWGSSFGPRVDTEPDLLGRATSPTPAVQSPSAPGMIPGGVGGMMSPAATRAGESAPRTAQFAPAESLVPEDETPEFGPSAFGLVVGAPDSIHDTDEWTETA